MGNKTIYVSEKDEQVFDDAKNIAGEALSSVIVRALKEFIARNEKKEKGMREISVKVGPHGSEREQRFVGEEIGKWNGLDDEKEWIMDAKVYRTQKGNWAVLLTQSAKASLLTNPIKWTARGDYLENTNVSELIVAKTLKEFEGKVPKKLLDTLQNLAKKYEAPVEYLDI